MKLRTKSNLDHLMKAAFNPASPGDALGVERLAGKLGWTELETAAALHHLEKQGLAVSRDGRWALSPAGEERAWKLHRAHRLLEQKVAETSGLPAEEWHKFADRHEHSLSEAELEQLAASLRYPRFDPHGDPIPTRRGEMPAQRTIPLSEIEQDGVYVISHIEDEPPAIFAKLAGAGLSPQLQVRVQKLDATAYMIRFAGGTLALNRAEADQIELVPLPEEHPQQAGATLLDLPEGSSGTVAALSPACRGLERRRLLDLGFVRGSRIRRGRAGLFSGPIQFEVRGTVIALRPEQARKVFIS